MLDSHGERLSGILFSSESQLLHFGFYNLLDFDFLPKPIRLILAIPFQPIRLILTPSPSPPSYFSKYDSCSITDEEKTEADKGCGVVCVCESKCSPAKTESEAAPPKHNRKS